MPLFKKKKETKEYKGAKVQLKKESDHKRASNKSSKAKTKKTKKKKKFKRRKNFHINFLYIFAGLLTVGLVLGLTYGVYLSAVWVIDTRASKVETENFTGEVLGFSNVPEYPESEYIFLPSDEPDSVKEFTSTGRSIYRLDWDSDIEDVYEFYEEELPENGWTHVLSVERTSKEQYYGEYWIDQNEEYGIRIYDRVNDIWYEKLSVEDAKTGLKERYARELERELLIASDVGTDLLPDFPWSLTIPKEYLIKYFPTDEGDLRGVQFVKSGTELEYIFEPVTKIKGEAMDLYLEEYKNMINLRLEAGEEDHRWEIINSKYLTIAGRLILEGSVTSSKGDGKIYILFNEKIEYVYAFFQTNQDDSFTQFFLKTVKMKNTEHTGEEFEF